MQTKPSRWLTRTDISTVSGIKTVEAADKAMASYNTVIGG
jgi:hypothetical protein